MSSANRFETQNLLAQLELRQQQLKLADGELRKFSKTAPAAEREGRKVLDTMPEVGAVTIDVVLSELGDWRRFRSAKQAVFLRPYCPKRRALKPEAQANESLRFPSLARRA